MVLTRRFAASARLAAVLTVLLPAFARAHVAEFEATLDTAQEVPAPGGASAGAGGSGTFILEDDGTVEASVTFQGLTGAPILAHIHQGEPGVPGGIVSDFTPSLSGITGTSGTIAGVGTVALTDAQQQTLFGGGMYFNIHTPTNGAGEIRGQIRLKPGACSCDDATSPGSFKRCVKQAIRQIERAERGEAAVKGLRKLVAKSSCGKTKAPKRLVACCLPFSPAQNIVTDLMCASLKPAACGRLRGTNLGTGIPCSPNPCQ